MCSPPFQVSTSTRLGVAARGGQELKLVEIMTWDQSQSVEKEDGKNEMFCARTTILGSFADIDAVDGSYSLHSFKQQDENRGDEPESQKEVCKSTLPYSISGVDPNRVSSSIIESCLVANQNERVRCFMIYGPNIDGSLEEERLLRVVVSHEKKMKNDFKELLQESAGSSDDNRLKGLLSSDMYSPQKDLGKNVKVPINMMLLSIGPWLGDTIIRDKSYNMLLPKNKESSKTSRGFGKSSSFSSKSRGEREGGFGEWVLGVQKSVITFKYDFDCNCRQMVDFGKYIGVQVEGWPRQSFGIIYDDRMSRRIKPKDRSCYIDFDNGAYCGFIFGSVYIKAPRFLTSKHMGASSSPVYTEFALYQRPEDEERNKENDDRYDDICCSRITRLYDESGSLKQGCTSFFVLKPMVDSIDR